MNYLNSFFSVDLRPIYYATILVLFCLTSNFSYGQLVSSLEVGYSPSLSYETGFIRERDPRIGHAVSITSSLRKNSLFRYGFSFLEGGSSSKVQLPSGEGKIRSVNRILSLITSYDLVLGENISFSPSISLGYLISASNVIIDSSGDRERFRQNQTEDLRRPVLNIGLSIGYGFNINKVPLKTGVSSYLTPFSLRKETSDKVRLYGFGLFTNVVLWRR